MATLWHLDQLCAPPAPRPFPERPYRLLVPPRPGDPCLLVDLPDELLLRVLQYVQPDEWVRLACVCRRLRRVMGDRRLGAALWRRWARDAGVERVAFHVRPAPQGELCVAGAGPHRLPPYLLGRPWILHSCSRCHELRVRRVLEARDLRPDVRTTADRPSADDDPLGADADRAVLDVCQFRCRRCTDRKIAVRCGRGPREHRMPPTLAPVLVRYVHMRLLQRLYKSGDVASIVAGNDPDLVRTLTTVRAMRMETLRFRMFRSDPANPAGVAYVLPDFYPPVPWLDACQTVAQLLYGPLVPGETLFAEDDSVEIKLPPLTSMMRGMADSAFFGPSIRRYLAACLAEPWPQSWVGSVQRGLRCRGSICGGAG
jgi:hypothetical protein